MYEAEYRPGERAFSEDVAADATVAMQAVVESGTGRGARLEGGRPAAGKTGTSSDNKDAWFVGFTPQLSTAVWLGYAQPQTIRIDGVEATGGGFSTRIWKAYTDVALEGVEEEDFPERADVGRRQGSSEESTPRPRATRAPSSPSPEATEAVEPTEAPVETAEPEEPVEPEQPDPPQETAAPPPPEDEEPPPGRASPAG